MIKVNLTGEKKQMTSLPARHKKTVIRDYT